MYDTDQTYQASGLSIFFEYMGEYWYIILVYIGLSFTYVIETYLTRYLGYLIGNKSDKTISSNKSFYAILVILIISVTFRGGLYLLDSYFLPYFEKNVRLNLMERDLNDQKIEVGVSLKDAMTLPESMKYVFEIMRYTLIPSFFSTLSVIYLIYTISPKISLFVVLIFVFVIIICIFQVYGMNEFYSRQEVRAGDIISANHADVIRNRNVVIQYDQIVNELELNNHLNKNYNLFYQGRFLFNYLFKILIIGLSYILLLGASVHGYIKFKNDAISVSQFSTLTLLLTKSVELNGRYIISIGEFAHLWKLLNIKMCFKHRNFGFFGYRGQKGNSDPLIQQHLGSHPVPTHADDTQDAAMYIHFQNVRIKRGSFVLQINDLKLSHAITCIQGLSGSGKTSLINTMMKNITSYDGSITFLGKALKKWTYFDVHQKIAYIPQISTLFNRTLLENIIYNSNKTRSDVLDLMKVLNITNISENDLDRVVSPSSDNFSGGQIQISSILRALLHKKDFIILDEPTSALDDYNKLNVINAIIQMSRFTKILIVTHDRSLSFLADHLLVLNEGTINREHIQNNSIETKTSINDQNREEMNNYFR